MDYHVACSRVQISWRPRGLWNIQHGNVWLGSFQIRQIRPIEIVRSVLDFHNRSEIWRSSLLANIVAATPNNIWSDVNISTHNFARSRLQETLHKGVLSDTETSAAWLVVVHLPDRLTASTRTVPWRYGSWFTVRIHVDGSGDAVPVLLHFYLATDSKAGKKTLHTGSWRNS